MKVPLVDLQSQFKILKDRVMPGIERVISGSSFILGEDVEAFENEFAEFCQSRHCVSVGSGCDALLMALKACEIGPGDEVITPTNTFIATVLAITAAGARPVLVDCLDSGYQIDPEAVKKAITKNTRAILPVHLYGQAADMDQIQVIADENNLIVIEDAAQAHGATYQGKSCGSMGKVGCFSFYPGKNLGGYGDGGAIITESSDIAEKVKMLRNYGQSKKYHHDIAGWNSRLDTIQAVVLREKLKLLHEWNNLRHRHAGSYFEQLKDLPVTLPIELSGNKHIYHVFAIQTDNRDEILSYMQSKEIFCGIHYPIPVHLQPAYQNLGYKPGDFPRAEKIAHRLLSLPMYPDLTPDQVSYVSDTLKGWFS